MALKPVSQEFLMLLKGVIDCPDLPLNVSRSALQNDGFVKKISEIMNKKFPGWRKNCYYKKFDFRKWHGRKIH